MSEAGKPFVIEVMDGLKVEIDPAKWDVSGTPLMVMMAAQPSKLQLDLHVFVTPAGQESMVKNLLTVTKARR